MCPTSPISQDYDLAASVSEAIAKAARAVSDACEKKFSLPIRLWKLSRNIKEVFDRCNLVGVAGFIASDNGGQHWADDFRNLHAKTEQLMAICRRRNLTNQTTTAGSLEVIRRYADEFLDLAELIDLAMNPRTGQHFQDAREEIEAGQFHDFFSLPQ